MGNASSAVTAGIKNQVNASNNAINKLADMSGRGFLADLAMEAVKTGNHEELNRQILEVSLSKDLVTVVLIQKVEPMLYNNGLGEMIPLSDIIAQRHKERTGNAFAVTNPSTECRFICWKLNSRGAVGETLLHTCFLAGLPDHMKLLAERLIAIFPKIINDFYLSDEYYGETVLHMGIVSENAEFVRYLLKNGADVHARCSGNFFTCDDQKGSRTDHPEVEHAIISKHTKYPGHIYWGEYPLSFAACLSQPECIRMLVAHGADVNAADTNGNTILHICTIHENWEMFKMALTLGADLHIQNRQNLTPLTLAAFLAKKEMMQKIVEEERTVNWTYGRTQSAAYPLEHVDSIEPTSGSINQKSVLTIAVYGEKAEHLSLLPHLLEQLVHHKWIAYGRKTLFAQLFMFCIYFVCVTSCFLLRPSPFERKQHISNDLICFYDFKTRSFNESAVSTIIYHLLHLICVTGATLYLVQALLHIKNVGYHLYVLGLSGFPAKAIFLFSCILMVITFFLRIFCLDEAEDIVWIVIVLLTSLKFLFFCRGFKSVGPFVLMLYKIIIRDLMRFFLIYLVIVVGFSQAFYVIFLGYKRNDSGNREPSIMSNVAESYVRMFIMSLTEFTVFFEQLEECEHTVIGKITFVVYMLLVTLLLINMLIAMMTNTYTEVSGNSLEWLRQWSAIILMMEQSFDPATRLRYQRRYGIRFDGGEKLVLLLKDKMTEDEFECQRKKMHEDRRKFREELRTNQRRRPAFICKQGANYFKSKHRHTNNKLIVPS
ncbi:CRE-OCR-4 protein [Caenorhabditis remanei]|uniref:CRE-OCR-4 protein n=1 Tax=Caenorhabditis remanei TaxID=31234 RepID=E3M795_CAERE|nr:CRE-OCR-4 protein [Caenorhabditis remanei]